MRRSHDDEVAAYARAHRRRWMGWGIPLMAVAALLGGLVFHAAFAARRALPFGAPCETSDDCGPRGRCLVAAEGSTCTRYCEQSSECPPGWTCEMHWELMKNGETSSIGIRACAKH